MHQALQYLHDQKSLSEVSDNLEQLLTRYWDKSAFATREEERSYFNRGCEALKNYCSAAKLNPTETVGTEVYLAFVVELNGKKIRLGCKVDRLALHFDQTLEIIDYKTNKSGKVPVADFLLKDLPTFLYFVLTRLSYPQYPNLKVTFLNVLTMDSISITYDKELIAENRTALWNCLKNIATSEYNPRTSENCCWCDYQDSCPAVNRIADLGAI